MRLATTYIFRIIHIDNLDFILKEKNLTNKFDVNANPNYVGIGESDLIGKREDIIVTTADGGKDYNPSHDYLPFYFHWQSVMLYRIQKGFGVAKRPPEDIIYLVCKLDQIIDKIDYLFTDGHGYSYLTSWYEKIESLSHLDPIDIRRVRWENTPADPDIRRRKQAEFWIKQPLALDLIRGVATYDYVARNKVKEMCAKHGKNMEVKIKPNYYY